MRRSYLLWQHGFAVAHLIDAMEEGEKARTLTNVVLVNP